MPAEPGMQNERARAAQTGAHAQAEHLRGCQAARRALASRAGAFLREAISHVRSFTEFARRCSLTSVRSGRKAALRTSMVACGSAWPHMNTSSAAYSASGQLWML